MVGRKDEEALIGAGGRSKTHNHGGNRRTMARREGGGRRPASRNYQIAPMIDVLLVLLIFFHEQSPPHRVLKVGPRKHHTPSPGRTTAIKEGTNMRAEAIVNIRLARNRNKKGGVILLRTTRSTNEPQPAHHSAPPRTPARRARAKGARKGKQNPHLPLLSSRGDPRRPSALSVFPAP